MGLGKPKPGTRTQALTDVSFEVQAGETLGLLGPNGAGKTTLLKIVSTLLYPSSGHVRLYGQDIFDQQIRTRGMLGLVTCDERSFYWRLSARQNLSFFASLYGLSREQFHERSEELLETLGLTYAADRPYHTYSAGMKQKLAIARGLLSRPRLVLYDEPTRSLDPLSTQNIRNWIADRKRHSVEQTHLIATNTLSEAEQLCDRVIIINLGRIIAHGTIASIKERWQQHSYEVHHVTYRGPAPESILTADEESGLLDFKREQDDGDEFTLRLQISRESEALSHALRQLLDAGAVIVRCDREEVPFDDVFCSLVLGDRERASAQPALAQGGAA